MAKQVEFLFDLGSPYSYLAYHQLPKMTKAKGATILWRPVLLGGLFQATGNRSPIEVPAKGRYSMIDLQRWADVYGVRLTMNPHFPINTLSLMRGAVAMQMAGDAELQSYLEVIFSAMFEVPRNMNDPAEVAAVLQACGFDPASFMESISASEVKEKLKSNTADAVARGAFGAPTFFVGEDMFWGQDRLQFVEAALAS